MLRLLVPRKCTTSWQLLQLSAPSRPAIRARQLCGLCATSSQQDTEFAALEPVSASRTGLHLGWDTPGARHAKAPHLEVVLKLLHRLGDRLHGLLQRPSGRVLGLVPLEALDVVIRRSALHRDLVPVL